MAGVDLGAPGAVGEPEELQARGEFERALDAEAEATAELPAGRKTRFRLESSLAIRTHLLRIYTDVREGRLSSLEGNRQVKILTAIGKVNEELGVEKRLRRLEEAEESRRRGTRR